MRAAAESAMRAVIADTTLDQALGSGRTGIEQRVQDLTQSILNEYYSGVRIRGVAIKQATPPAQIVDDFNKVTAAQQEAVANVNQARSYAQQVIARAQGEAAQFDKVYEQYRRPRSDAPAHVLRDHGGRAGQVGQDHRRDAGRRTLSAAGQGRT
ncbi:hypothetical protein SPKIRA_18500 [Sphingomonas paucimobilis]|nr:hypothetical protein SPKIRA_18500 [Sphingomonas paucimobilis]